jgi:hypothetical protein
MQKIMTWSYDEVAKALDDKRTNEEVGKEMGRTTVAIESLRHQATMFKKDENAKWISQNVRGHFQRYFVNKGNMKLQAMPNGKPQMQPKVVVADKCEQELDSMMNNANETFELLKHQLSEIAQLTVTHQNHKVLEELEALRAWKKENEPELIQLRELKKTAQKSNFASMVRSKITQPFNRQPTT